MHHLGFTRSVSRREYLLHTPDAFVRTPLPGLTRGSAIVHVAPQMGAQFAMTTVEFDGPGVLAASPVQRFVYVLEGRVVLEGVASSQSSSLGPDGYAYLPSSASRLTTPGPARILLFEKVFTPLPGAPAGEPGPDPLSGEETAITPVALNEDERLQVRALIPAGMPFDFAVNTMTYEPGASLSQVEVHYMEHGLLMLEGSGLYRLGDEWHPVTAGDVIWMAPFCPQWFVAVGKTPAKYLIYKDFNRAVLP